MKTLNKARDAAFLALTKEHQQSVFHHFISTGHCWRFQRSRKAAYGRFSFNGTKIQAHRAAYLATHGEIPDGLLVLHRCNNPKCINPEHLKIGTQVENMADRSRAGRHWLQKNPELSSIHKLNAENAILTRDVILGIFAMRREGKTHEAIASSYGCSRASVSYALSGKRGRAFFKAEELSQLSEI